MRATYIGANTNPDASQYRYFKTFICGNAVACARLSMVTDPRRFWKKVCMFAFAKDHSGVRVAIKCDVSVNGTPLLKEVHMDSEYKCDIYISNKCIGPHALGLPDNLATTSISPHTYIKLVQSCRICTGK